MLLGVRRRTPQAPRSSRSPVGRRSPTSWVSSRALLSVADTVLIGGGMCFTFFKAMGNPIGDSLCGDDQVDLCGAARGVR